MTKKKKPNNMPQTAINHEFKETAIKLALAGDKPISQVATELGIPVKNLYNWLSVWKKKHGDNITVKSSATKSSSDEELRKLQKRNRELELEVEIQKKRLRISPRPCCEIRVHTKPREAVSD